MFHFLPPLTWSDLVQPDPLDDQLLEANADPFPSGLHRRVPAEPHPRYVRRAHHLPKVRHELSSLHGT